MAPQAVGVSGIRSARYVGLVKTHLQNIDIAAAINFNRIVACLNEIPRAKPALLALPGLPLFLSSSLTVFRKT
jgi:hypothetical protein